MKEESTPPYGLFQLLSNMGTAVTYWPSFAHALDDLCAALFLSNFLFWQGKQHDPDGWIFKRQADILVETGLSRPRQESARKRLRELGILEEKRTGQPALLYYKFDWKRAEQIVVEHLQKTGAKPRPKKKKPGSEKSQAEPGAPPLISRMVELFNQYYEHHTQGIGFEWGKSKETSGKHFGNLANLRDCLIKREVERLKFQALKEYEGVLPDNWEPAPVTDEQVCNNWENFLRMLPDYHRRMNFTPEKLYSNFNVIILDILKVKRNVNTADNSNEIARHAAAAGVE